MNRPLHRAARAALDALLSDDHAATDRALDQLLADHGPAAIPVALMHWCDAALEHMEPDGEGPVELVWKDTATGRVHSTINEVPIADQWAGRLLAARASADRAMFIALVEAVPADAVNAHVGAMVQMAACIIREAR